MCYEYVITRQTLQQLLETHSNCESYMVQIISTKVFDEKIDKICIEFFRFNGFQIFFKKKIKKK